MNKPTPRLLAITAALALALCGGAFAQTSAAAGDQAAPAGSMTAAKPDAAFVKMASASSLAEISLGKLGTENGKSDAVKTFGQTMVDDHTKANDELKGIADGKSIPVSTAPMAADTKAAAMIGKKQGAAFDTAFKTKMIADHKKAVQLFTKESSSGKDPDLKAFATKTLPTLQHHLEMAEQLPSGK